MSCELDLFISAEVTPPTNITFFNTQSSYHITTTVLPTCNVTLRRDLGALDLTIYHSVSLQCSFCLLSERDSKLNFFLAVFALTVYMRKYVLFR